ncbi:MAG: hypothetical protein DMG86_22335 [Acidobacteria bacterium]|nr:MAG: hypothetical protein DMG86_22335 [Acidobacteriota bacterium]PYX13340.1 MAG: hypothetical protein DMG84_19440 [Acidobacteriota bacterium]
MRKFSHPGCRAGDPARSGLPECLIRDSWNDVSQLKVLTRSFAHLHQKRTYCTFAPTMALLFIIVRIFLLTSLIIKTDSAHGSVIW